VQLLQLLLHTPMQQAWCASKLLQSPEKALPTGRCDDEIHNCCGNQDLQHQRHNHKHTVSNNDSK
jgi:hypothetical protein